MRYYLITTKNFITIANDTVYEKINTNSSFIQDKIRYSCASLIVVASQITTITEVFMYEEYFNKLKEECLIRNRAENPAGGPEKSGKLPEHPGACSRILTDSCR